MRQSLQRRMGSGPLSELIDEGLQATKPLPVVLIEYLEELAMDNKLEHREHILDILPGSPFGGTLNRLIGLMGSTCKVESALNKLDHSYTVSHFLIVNSSSSSK